MRRPSSLIYLCSTMRWKKVVSPVRTYSSGLVRNSNGDPFSSTTSPWKKYENHEFSRISSYQHYAYARFFSSAPLPSSSTTNNENESTNRLGTVEIISVENIKPASPTPHHLRTYEVSMLDQFIGNMYLSFVYFFPNKDENGSNLDLISKKRQLLKQTLSETLTRFYPLAGKLDGELRIDCNDDGAYYVEAKVNDRLSDFLQNPDNKSIHKLLPFVPNSMELLLKTSLVMIQTTIFGCGGISIGLHTSHKIIDGYSHVTFFNAWANAARGSSSEDDMIRPSFIAPSIFPPNPNPTQDSTLLGQILDAYPQNAGKVVTRRFIFPASSLKTLKEKAAAPSRVVGVSGLIWKCIMAASRARTSAEGGEPNPSILIFPVNIRARTSPHFPPYSIGNNLMLTFTRFKNDDDAVGLNSIVELVKNATSKVNSEFTEKFKGEEGYHKMVENYKEVKQLCSGKNVEQVSMTSLCNSGIYDIDFGWGKPTWISVADAGADIPFFKSMVYLMDTKSKDGIEAWVTLLEQDMALFERNAELLAFASLSHSPPLQTQVD
ncbi:hypothetical protein ACJIZ3_013619 [Penstemon smallii]|uniref:Transferase n=1 Tax=Penstemon smallii TaxID=265156 RepID=A0ABD3RNZ4_9LAMI